MIINTTCLFINKELLKLVEYTFTFVEVISETQ